MALPAYQSQGTVVATSTAAPAGYPASFAAGDLLLLFVSSTTGTISTTVTGWTSLGSVQTGGGSSVAAWSKTATGSETGTVSVSITGGVGVAYTVAYRSTGSGGLSAALYRGGSDVDTTSTAFSAGGASWTLAVNDRIVSSTLAVAAGTFTASFSGTPALTQAGATAATSTIRFSARANTNTTYYNHSDAAVTGAGSGVPTFAGTAVGANASGSTVFVTVREIANVPPNVTPPANQSVAAGATANMPFTPPDPDGSIASRSTAFDFSQAGGNPSITGGTTATPSFTAGSAPNLYVVRHAATDNGGLTSSATTEVRVPTSGTIDPIPGFDGTGATWTEVGGAASQGAALTDASDSTYLESPSLSGTETERRWRIDAATTRATLTITFRVAQDSAGTVVCKGRLYEANTLRQEWTLPTTTTPTDQPCVLSGATIAAISDWGNLWVAVAGTG